jgi:hypothetical protein
METESSKSAIIPEDGMELRECSAIFVYDGLI